MRSVLPIALLVVACAHPVIERAREPALTYAIAIDETLAHMRVSVCPSAARLPAALVPIHRAALAHLASVELVLPDGGVRALPVGERIDLTEAPPRACVRYDVDFTACDEPHGPPSCARAGRDLFAPTSTWLLAPETRVIAAHYAMRLELPAGVHVTPFGARESSPGVLELDDRAFAFVSYVAFTHDEAHALAVPGGGCVDLVTLEGALAASDADRTEWLTRAASASARVTGTVPSERLTTIVVPTIDVPSMPVVFGVAGRGMQPTITLFVSANATAEPLVHDWTAVHELAHLLIADLDEDQWLSEGIATYYEEVLRAREGLLSEADAWSAIASGFERGRAGCQTGVTLREASRTMHSSHAYACVYWSGAAIALLADTAYRRAGSSLDEAIVRAWPRRAEHTSATELVRWLDGETDGVLAHIAATALDATTFPDTTAALAADEAAVAMRHAIMNGPSPTPSNPSSCTR
jgi:hypothetical protein